MAGAGSYERGGLWHSTVSEPEGEPGKRRRLGEPKTRGSAAKTPARHIPDARLSYPCPLANGWAAVRTKR